MVIHTCGMNFTCCLSPASLALLIAVSPSKDFWADVIQIKDGKRSNLGGTSLKKRSILFNSAKLRETNITQNATNYDSSDFFGNDVIK